MKASHTSIRGKMNVCGIFLILLLVATGHHAVGQGTKDGDAYKNVEGANIDEIFNQRIKNLGGRKDFDYLALKDHIGPSGVPLGGIGVGCFDLAPDGRFTRIALNCTHEAGVIKDTKAGFLALWEGPTSNTAPSVRRLVRDEEQQYGLGGVDHTVYEGLFPIARIDYSDDSAVCRVSVTAYSGLVPHKLKDSTLPVAWFDVELHNPLDEPIDVGVALSWENIISRHIRDVADMETLKGLGKNASNAFTQTGYHFKRVPVTANSYRNGKLSGILQSADEPLKPLKATYQNYVEQTALLVDAGAGDLVSFLPGYSVDNGTHAWSSFSKNGTFAGAEKSAKLELPGEDASAVALKTRLAAGEKRTVRFMVAWFFPELEIDRENDHPNRYFGTADYGRYFHNHFDNIDTLIRYASAERARILEQTREWQMPILASTYPDWLKFKLINSGYVLFTNSILNKEGIFTSMEGMMGGAAGTMDQRISSHPVYQKFFTELDRSEMDIFGASAGEGGRILHFCGTYYQGIATREGLTPTPGGWMIDNTGGWIIQIAKDYQQTGDIDWLKHNADRVRKAMSFLRSILGSQIEIPIGPTTYDDFSHPPIYAYSAGIYLATLNAAIEIGKALGDAAMVREYREQFERTQTDFMRYLWNGRYFNYGCEEDGSDPNRWMFTGQLAGQFVSRYCGWGDVLPLPVVQNSVRSQLRDTVAVHEDYYAPKIYDIEARKDISFPGSYCWPFYLDSYTAMLAIQAGYVDDGLEIMRHTQLVHLRNGWTWTQNLWNPAEATYMTAPVTWFITDVLAGSALDAPSGTLWLAPLIRGGEKRVNLPIYFPEFWAVLECDTSSREAKLRIIKTFGDNNTLINRVVSTPVGTPTADGRTLEMEPFAVRTGAVLDLSEHWDEITASVQHPAILPRPDEVAIEKIEPRLPPRRPTIKSSDSIVIDSVWVELSSQDESAKIRYTLDGGDPREAGDWYRQRIVLKDSTVLKARSFTSEQGWSPISERRFEKEPYRKAAAAAATRPGLKYRYYEGEWMQLPDFDRLPVVASGTTPGIDLGMRRQEDYFGVVFEGYIAIERRGLYTFHLRSDDGSRLHIGDDVLSHDGVHGMASEKVIRLPLEKGNHKFKLEFFEAQGGQAIDLKWEGPGFEIASVPSSVYRHEGDPSLATEAVQSAIEISGRLDLGKLGRDGIDVLRDHSGTPNEFGVLEYYQLELPAFDEGVYYSSAWWPSGGNRVYPHYVRNNSLAGIREGGMFLLLKLEDASYMALTPMLGVSSYSWLKPHEGKLLLCIGTLGTAPVKGDMPRFAWARSKDPYAACQTAFKKALEDPGATAQIRSEKEYPEIFEYLGWCSWEEYKCKISSDMLIESVRQIENSEVPIRYIIMDAGHQHYTAHQALFGVLKSFKADPVSFPDGYGPLLDMRKDDKVKWMGVWLGHLAGSCGVSIENELGDLNASLMQVGNRLLPKDDAASADRFYDAFIREAAAGFDFAKVDFQSRALGYYSGADNPLKGVENNARAIANPIQAAANTSRALEQACDRHLNGLINCNGHNTPSVLNWRYSSVSRCSEDYSKGNLGAARRHIYHSYAAMPWLGQIAWGDHDMFHSNDTLAARMMAISKSMSGAPVYLSDDPAEFDPEHVWPMCYRDGELLRPLAPAAPLPECLFTDATKDGRAYKVIAPLPNQSAAIVAYNLLDDREGVVAGSITADDYTHASAMLQPYPGKWSVPAEGLVVYDWYDNKAERIESGRSFEIKGFGDRLYLLTPIKDGWSIIGRTDKFLAPAAFEILESDGTGMTLRLKEAGPLTIWSEKGCPTAVGIEFKQIADNLYQADIAPGSGDKIIKLTST